MDIPSHIRHPNHTRYTMPEKTGWQTQYQYHGSLLGPKTNSQIEKPRKIPWNRIWQLVTSRLSSIASKRCPLRSFPTIVSRRCITGSVGVGVPIRMVRSLMILETRPKEFSEMVIMDIRCWSCSKNLATPMENPEMDLKTIIFQ
jgi:hypothetical protein